MSIDRAVFSCPPLSFSPFSSPSIPSRSTSRSLFLPSFDVIPFVSSLFFSFFFFSFLFFSSLHFNGMFRVLPSLLVFFFLIVAVVVVCTFLRYTRERSCRSHRCTPRLVLDWLSKGKPGAHLSRKEISNLPLSVKARRKKGRRMKRGVATLMYRGNVFTSNIEYMPRTF